MPEAGRFGGPDFGPAHTTRQIFRLSDIPVGIYNAVLGVCNSFRLLNEITSLQTLNWFIILEIWQTPLLYLKSIYLGIQGHRHK